MEIQNPKPRYDLEERTFQFAKAVRLFAEMNALKSAYEGQSLIQEANELKKIFSSILEKSK